MPTNFAIAAINTATGEIGVMSFAETRSEAEAKLDEATRAVGYVQATICESLEQLHQLDKAARIAKSLL